MKNHEDVKKVMQRSTVRYLKLTLTELLNSENVPPVEDREK